MTELRRWPPERMLAEAPAFVVTYLAWWLLHGYAHHGKRNRHRPTYRTSDLALRAQALEAVRLCGGWREVRVLMRGWVPDKVLVVRRARGIRVREEG